MKRSELGGREETRVQGSKYACHRAAVAHHDGREGHHPLSQRQVEPEAMREGSLVIKYTFGHCDDEARCHIITASTQPCGRAPQRCDVIK